MFSFSKCATNPLSKPENRTALIVLGMHRSGTSAMGGVLNLLGVDFGERLYQAQQNVNEKGFWEHSAIVDLHDELLIELASSWDDPRVLPEGWQERENIAAFRTRMARIATEDFANSPLWGLKDPRMCRLLPFWRDLFAELAVKPLYLIMVRNPLEVAASLHKRNGFSLDKGLFLWWQHQVLAERATRDAPRVFVSFPDLLVQPEATLERIAQRLDLEWPTPLAQALPGISEFLTPSLRHHRELAFTGGSRLDIDVEAAYRSYLDAAADLGDSTAGAEAAFLAYYRDLNPLLLEHLASLAEEHRAAQQTLARNYRCFAIKIAKRLCLLEQALAPFFASRR